VPDIHTKMATLKEMRAEINGKTDILRPDVADYGAEAEFEVWVDNKGNISGILCFSY